MTGLLGPAQRVTAMSGIVAPKRRAQGGKFDGLEIVTEDDNTLVMLDFGTLVFAIVDGTFSVVATKSAGRWRFGLEGTIVVTPRRRRSSPGPAPHRVIPH